VEFDQLIEAFNAGRGAQRGINIEYTVYGADWQTAIAMAVDTNRAPDLMKGSSNTQDYALSGKYLPLTEVPGIEDILRAQAPYNANLATHFAGIQYSVGLYGWAPGFHYNKALLQRAGYSAPPKTWAEFEDAAIKISKLEPGVIYGYAMPLMWSPDFTTWMSESLAANSVGHMYWNYTTGKFNFADFAPYFELLARIRDAGAMFPGMESLSDDQQRAHFADGKIGFIGGAGWNVGVLYDQFPFGGGSTGRPNNAQGWDYAPLPVRDPNNVYKVPVGAGAYHFINSEVRNDKDKLSKIGDVFRLFTDDAAQILMFTNGKHVPLRPDIAAKAAPSDRVQFTTYGKVAGPVVTIPANPISRLTPEGPDRVAVIGQILTGQIPISGIRNALEDLGRRYDAAFDQAVTRGQINRADYIDPSIEANFKM
jgi:multiple sugar transport system substrate-binding protein